MTERNPEAAIDRQLNEAGLTIKGEDIPTPRDPALYIKQQLEFAEAVGAKITRAPSWPSTWLDMPREHVCSCSDCDFRVRPMENRSSPHHYSVAFGDAVLQVVKLQGSEWELTHDVVEVNVDDDYAIRVSQPLHECGNCLRRKGGGGGVCLYRDKGEFGVRLEKQAV